MINKYHWVLIFLIVGLNNCAISSAVKPTREYFEPVPHRTEITPLKSAYDDCIDKYTYEVGGGGITAMFINCMGLHGWREVRKD